MANVTDKITDTRNAARPVSTTVSSGRSAGGGTLACASLTGWPTASKLHFVTYTVDSNSNPVAGSQLDCTGIVSGSNITSFTVKDGTDTGNSIGDVVEMLPTAAWGQDLSDALTAEHSRTGTHAAITTTSINNAGTLTQTGQATFVAGTTLPAGDIGTADIAADAVTAAKLLKGNVSSEQGGSASDVTTAGTSNFDISAVDYRIEMGTILVDADPKTVTFSAAFASKPRVFVQVADNTGANCYAISKAADISTTICKIHVVTDSGSANTGQTVFWMAIGKA